MPPNLIVAFVLIFVMPPQCVLWIAFIATFEQDRRAKKEEKTLDQEPRDAPPR